MDILTDILTDRVSGSIFCFSAIKHKFKKLISGSNASSNGIITMHAQIVWYGA